MNAPRIIRLLLLSMLLCFCGTGCVTHALWSHGTFDEWNEPAQSPNLRLYLRPDHKDFLAVYDEYSGRHDSTHTRAYWVYGNDSRTAKRHRPEFISTNTVEGLIPLPLFTDAPVSTNAPDFLYARMLSPGREFAMYSGDRQVSYHELPTYNDGAGLSARIALTPVTVTADLVIVAVVVGVAVIVEGGGWSALNNL
jgi:hypothetical protein